MLDRARSRASSGNPWRGNWEFHPGDRELLQRLASGASPGLTNALESFGGQWYYRFLKQEWSDTTACGGRANRQEALALWRLATSPRHGACTTDCGRPQAPALGGSRPPQTCGSSPDPEERDAVVASPATAVDPRDGGDLGLRQANISFRSVVCRPNIARFMRTPKG